MPPFAVKPRPDLASLARRLKELGLLAMLGCLVACGQAAMPQPSPHTSYTLLDGQVQRLQELQGRVVLVNFWATSCTVCVAEMAQVAALTQRHRAQGLHTLAVAMHYDPPAYVAAYAQRHELPFGVVIDNTRAVELAFGGVAGTPTFYLLNRQGQVLRRIVGKPDFAALEAEIEQLLKKGNT